MELHNNIDNAFQMIHKALVGKALRWNDFKSVGVDTDYYDWYYAESQIYAVRNRITDSLYIVRAKSPKMAWEHYMADMNVDNCCGWCQECELEECEIRL